MSKVRKNRWSGRAALKHQSNKMRQRAAMHPQVRRLEDEKDYQVGELLLRISNIVHHFKSKPKK